MMKILTWASIWWRYLIEIKSLQALYLLLEGHNQWIIVVTLTAILLMKIKWVRATILRLLKDRIWLSSSVKQLAYDQFKKNQQNYLPKRKKVLGKASSTILCLNIIQLNQFLKTMKLIIFVTWAQIKKT